MEKFLEKIGELAFNQFIVEFVKKKRHILKLNEIKDLETFIFELFCFDCAYFHPGEFTLRLHITTLLSNANNFPLIIINFVTVINLRKAAVCYLSIKYDEQAKIVSVYSLAVCNLYF